MPVFVSVITRPDAGLRDCFYDTEHQIRDHGGGIVYGWLIWEWPGILIEGEFHAVWQKPDGGLLDVSRKDDGEERILFLPDPRMVFTGERIQNIRLPIGSNPRIRDFIADNERWFQMFKAHHGNAVGGVVLAPPLVELRQQIYRLAQELLQSRESRRASALFSRRRASR